MALVADVPGINRGLLVGGHVLAMAALWLRGRSLELMMVPALICIALGCPPPKRVPMMMPGWMDTAVTPSAM